MTTGALFLLLFGCMLLGMPIALALGLSSITTILFFSSDSLASIAKLFAIVPLKTKRSTDLTELFANTNWHSIPAQQYSSLSSAYRRLLKTCQADDTIIVVGSHFLVGEFFEKFGSG